MLTLPIRPADAIDRLVAALEPLGKSISISPRKRLMWENDDQPFVYVFLQGELSISRITDGILVATAIEPHIFGISGIFFPLRSNILRAETQCLLSRVDSHIAEEAIEQHGLWKDVSQLLAYHTDMMVFRDMQIVNQRTYPIVCHYLRELNLLPEEIKARVNILTYIQERTGLSRSSILNIISSLRTDRHIEFERGGYKLHVHNLPD